MGPGVTAGASVGSAATAGADATGAASATAGADATGAASATVGAVATGAGPAAGATGAVAAASAAEGASAGWPPTLERSEPRKPDQDAAEPGYEMEQLVGETHRPGQEPQPSAVEDAEGEEQERYRAQHDEDHVPAGPGQPEGGMEGHPATDEVHHVVGVARDQQRRPPARDGTPTRGLGMNPRSPSATSTTPRPSAHANPGSPAAARTMSRHSADAEPARDVRTGSVEAGAGAVMTGSLVLLGRARALADRLDHARVRQRRRVAQGSALRHVPQQPAHDLARARLGQVRREQQVLGPRDGPDDLGHVLTQLVGELLAVLDAGLERSRTRRWPGR